jgi:hypothetical protein
MGIPIQVTAVPQKLSGTATRPYLLTNDPSSSATVYIGQTSAINSSFNYALTLQPGASITWTDISSEVWAVTSSGSAAVTVAYEASGTFVPGKTGAAPTLLRTVTVPFGLTDTVLTQTAQDINISAYLSVKVMVSVNITTVPTGGTGLTNSWLYVDGTQYDSAFSGTNTTNFSRTNSACWTFGDGACQSTGLTNGIQTYQFAVQNSLLAFNIGVIKDVHNWGVGGVGTVTFRIYGTQQTVSADIYQNWVSSYGTFFRPPYRVGNTLTTTTAPVYRSVPNQSIPMSTTTAATVTYGIIDNVGEPSYGWPAQALIHFPTITGIPFSYTYTTSYTPATSIFAAGGSTIVLAAFPYAGISTSAAAIPTILRTIYSQPVIANWYQGTDSATLTFTRNAPMALYTDGMGQAVNGGVQNQLLTII